MICVNQNVDGLLVPSGVWSPGSSCSQVVLEPSEAVLLSQILVNPPKSNPLVDLSAADAGIISISIIGVWAIGLFFRELVVFSKHRLDGDN